MPRDQNTAELQTRDPPISNYTSEFMKFPPVTWVKSGDEDNLDASDRPSLMSFTSPTLPLDGYTAPLVPLISEIFCTDELCIVYHSALREVTIGKDCLRRIIQRLICHCGVEIQKEGLGDVARAAVRILRSEEISTQVIRHVERKFLQNGTLRPDTGVVENQTDVSDSDGERTEGRRAKIRVVKRPDSPMRSFVLQSNAYASFRWTLLRFVQAPYEERLLAALSQSAKSANGLPLEPTNLKSTVNELSWVPPSRLHISQEDKGSGLDKLKAWIELLTNEKWQWLLLSPCNIATPQGCHRLRWTTPSGHEQHLHYNDSHKEQLQVVLASAPGFLELPAGTPPSTTPAHSSQQGQTGGGGNVAPAATQIQSGPSSGHDPAPLPAGPSATNLVNLPSSVPAQPSTHHLYLCVQKGDEYRFPSIGIRPYMTDRECFDQLRRHYFEARGLLRRSFSIWRFDHCEFYQFRKHALGTGEPSKIDFPPDDQNKKDYEFDTPIEPRPPLGPIAEGELRVYFYKHCQPCNSVHRSWRRLVRQYFLNTSTYISAIKVLPKRRIEVQFNDGKREAIWGLYAVERISFAWVAAYGFLANVPSLVYFFLWLFYWRHDSDVQGASVPVSLTLTLTAMWIGLILASKK